LINAVPKPMTWAGVVYAPCLEHRPAGILGHAVVQVGHGVDGGIPGQRQSVSQLSLYRPITSPASLTRWPGSPPCRRDAGRSLRQVQAAAAKGPPPGRSPPTTWPASLMAADHCLSRPRRWAIAAASPRPATPSLARILETWMLAVLGVMNSAWPICRLVRPAATSASTSVSRRVSPRNAAGDSGASGSETVSTCSCGGAVRFGR
jgi:hypothetical protein